MFKSLKTRLMLILVLLIVLPVSILGGVSLYQFTQETQDQVSSKLDDLTTLTAKVIEEEIGQAKIIGSILSGNDTIANYLTGDQTLKQDTFNYIKQQQANNSGVIEMIVVADGNSLGLMSHANMELNTDLKSRTYLQTALSGNIGISDVITSKASNQSVIAVASPVKKDGKIVGAVITTVLYSNIAKNVADIHVFEEGYAYMFNQEGLILYHPNAEFVMTKNLNEFQVPELLQIQEGVKKGESGEVYYTYQGVKKYVKYVSVAGMGLAITANVSDYMKSLNVIRTIMFTIMIVGVLGASIFAYFFSERRIIKPLRLLSSTMVKAGDGDLTVSTHIETGDEMEQISTAFNSMIEHQREMVLRVKYGAVEIAQATGDIAASSNEVSHSAELMAITVQEVAENSTGQMNAVVDTSETLLQLASLIQLAKARAITAESNIKNSLEVASEGRKSVDITINAIQKIDSTSKETNELLKKLESLSIRVKGIIDTINGIAGQTNLLALNASIEAARAGEHGRGFAVVAEEVRKLAEQTSDEASGITSVVGEMVDNIQKAVASMELGYQSVREGVAKATHTDESFIEIVEAVEAIYLDVSKIVEVTDDEVSSSNLILNLIDEVSTKSENNAANSEEVSAHIEEQTSLIETIAAGTQELTAMANELKNMVTKFKVED